MLRRLVFSLVFCSSTLLFANEPCPEVNQIKIHEFTNVRSDPQNNYWEASILGKDFGTELSWDFLIGIFPIDFLKTMDEREQAYLAMQSLQLQRVEQNNAFQICFYTTNFKNINAVAITQIGGYLRSTT
ncbi:MAG: hypothetical protein EPN84_04305 [Legionella sp.]|nr:MAG: hypothetical protein EPN84_04305 [Legionella sp.]